MELMMTSEVAENGTFQLVELQHYATRGVSMELC